LIRALNCFAASRMSTERARSITSAGMVITRPRA
jgi:hypothetical protein